MASTRRKRGMNPLVYFGLAIILFSMATIGFNLWGTGEIQPFAIDTGVQSGDFISVPTYGYLACEESDETISTNWESFSSRTITCSNAERADLVEDCTVTLQTPSEEEVSGVANALLAYRVCDTTTDCDLSVSSAVQVKVRTFFVNQKVSQLIPVPLTENQYLLVGYKEGAVIDLTGGDWVGGKADFKISLRPFFLYRYDVFSKLNGASITGTQDCTSGSLPEQKFAILNVEGDGELESDLSVTDTANLNDLRLSRETRMTYISNFVGIVPQYQLFEDNTKYCYDKKIYAVEEIETPGGTYKVADTSTNAELETVECCNQGDVPVGSYCEDFEIKQLSTSEGAQCSALKPCPIVDYQATGGGNFYFQECVDGQCVTDKIEAECSFNTDCPNGYCDVDLDNPEDSECEEITVEDYCGNTICDAGETYETCPSDCDAPEPKSDFLLYLFIGLGFLAVIIIMLIIAQRMRQNQGGGF